MLIAARVDNQHRRHIVSLTTDGVVHDVQVAPRSSGFGSSVNGGELLCLALATCYCNDIYREAAKRGIRVESVEVEVAGEFGSEGEGATNVRYQAKIAAHASEEIIRALGSETDRLAEIQNTLRVATPVTLSEIEPVSV